MDAHVHMWVLICMCVCTYMHTHTRTHTHTHMHTYQRAYMHICIQSQLDLTKCLGKNAIVIYICINVSFFNKCRQIFVLVF